MNGKLSKCTCENEIKIGLLLTTYNKYYSKQIKHVFHIILAFFLFISFYINGTNVMCFIYAALKAKQHFRSLTSALPPPCLLFRLRHTFCVTSVTLHQTKNSISSKQKSHCSSAAQTRAMNRNQTANCQLHSHPLQYWNSAYQYHKLGKTCIFMTILVH